MKMYPMQQKVFDEFQYCIACGRMVRAEKEIDLSEFHFPQFHIIRGNFYGLGVCEGPFTSCPPPEEGGFLLASDADFEQEEPEPTYEDIEFVRHYANLLDFINNI